jgi:hypothetical protein
MWRRERGGGGNRPRNFQDGWLCNYLYIQWCVKHCLDFSFVFSFAPLPGWRNLFVFSKGGWMGRSCVVEGVVEGTSQTKLGSSDHERYHQPALFLKSEKIPALLYGGKGPEYTPFTWVGQMEIYHFYLYMHHSCACLNKIT